MRRARRHTYSLRDQDVLRLDLPAVQVFVHIAILVHACTIQRNAGMELVSIPFSVVGVDPADARD